MEGEEELKKGRSPGYYSRQRFLKNKPAVAGLITIVLGVLVAIAGYLIVPDKSPNSSRQLLEIKTLEPGTRVMIMDVRRNAELPQSGFLKRMIYGQEPLHRQLPLYQYHIDGNFLVTERYRDEEDGEGMTEKFHLADIAFALGTDTSEITFENGVFELVLLDGSVHQIHYDELLERVENQHIYTRLFLFGTDRFGRDMFSRMVLGTRVSLSVGFIAVAISLSIGIALGAIAGFFRGKVDDFIMWLINVIWSIPTLLLVIAISFALGKGFWQVFIAVGLTMWVEVARIVRGQIFSVREKEYVEAGRAMGFSSGRIIYRHILPNIMGPVIVIAAANFASAILLEAGLSFLGVGVQPPTPSWGFMINEHFAFMMLGSAYLAIIPGLAIVTMVLSFYLLGNGLRDAYDVRSR